MTDDTVEIPKTAIVKAPRPQSVERAVEIAAAERAQLLHDLELARGENERIKHDAQVDRDAVMKLVNQAKEHCQKQDAEIADLKARCMTYQIERDEAVSRGAELQGLFVSMFAMMRAHSIPMTPIMREQIADDHEAPRATPLPPLAPPSHEEMIARINGK